MCFTSISKCYCSDDLFTFIINSNQIKTTRYHIVVRELKFRIYYYCCCCSCYCGRCCFVILRSKMIPVNQYKIIFTNGSKLNHIPSQQSKLGSSVHVFSFLLCACLCCRLCFRFCPHPLLADGVNNDFRLLSLLLLLLSSFLLVVVETGLIFDDLSQSQHMWTI